MTTLPLLLQLHHRLGVLHRPRQRLLAQHVLAGGDQRLGDRAVQRVADHDAHRVDRRVLGDGLPARQRLLVAVAARAVLGQRDVGVGDRGQPDRGEPRPGDRAGHPVGRRVAAAGHPCADHCDGDLLRHVLTLHSSDSAHCVERGSGASARQIASPAPADASLKRFNSVGECPGSCQDVERDPLSAGEPVRRPRLGDVAAAAGVSPATVSLVLRGVAGPSAATRERVLEAAAQLGYRPDRAASLLASRRSRLVGVVMDIANPFHAQLVRGRPGGRRAPRLRPRPERRHPEPRRAPGGGDAAGLPLRGPDPHRPAGSRRAPRRAGPAASRGGGRPPRPVRGRRRRPGRRRRGRRPGRRPPRRPGPPATSPTSTAAAVRSRRCAAAATSARCAPTAWATGSR